MALTAIRLDFGLVIGLTAGLVSFIPYVGALFGFLSSVGVALYQFWPDWMHIGFVLGVGVVGQVLESYALSPYLVGVSVGLHPVWLMFSLFAFGSLFGFFGLLIAVPLAATLGVLLRHAVLAYRKSPVYLDADGAS